ncbi:hypothetical protein EDD15DRAFT_2202324 [Pisolithus albus]|nr:hypothetical protein EDD15DRAFT_2202324 [Pisolithus albus]
MHEPGPQDPPSPRYKSFDSGPSFGNFGPLPDNRSCNGEPLWQKLWESPPPHIGGLTTHRSPDLAARGAVLLQKIPQCPLPVIPAPNPTSAMCSPYRRLIRRCPGAGNLTGSFTDEWWGHIGPNSLTTLVDRTLMSRRTAQQLPHLPDPIHPLSLSMLKSNTSSLKLSQLGCSKSDILCAEYTRD